MRKLQHDVLMGVVHGRDALAKIERYAINHMNREEMTEAAFLLLSSYCQEATEMAQKLEALVGKAWREGK